MFRCFSLMRQVFLERPVLMRVRIEKEKKKVSIALCATENRSALYALFPGVARSPRSSTVSQSSKLFDHTYHPLFPGCPHSISQTYCLELQTMFIQRGVYFPYVMPYCIHHHDVFKAYGVYLLIVPLFCARSLLLSPFSTITCTAL